MLTYLTPHLDCHSLLYHSLQIYQELAQQKKEKEERGNVNAPKQRDYEKEQVQTVTQIREKEAAGLGQSEDRYSLFAVYRIMFMLSLS